MAQALAQTERSGGVGSMFHPDVVADWLAAASQGGTGSVAGVPPPGSERDPGRSPVAALRLHAVFEAMSEGLVILDAAGQVLDANSAAERVLGLTRDQILGRAPLDPSWHAVREDGSPSPADEYPATVTLRTGAPLRAQLMGVRIDGRQDRWISINTEPLHEGDGEARAGVVATFVDVTAQRASIAELRRAQDQLHATIEELQTTTASIRESEHRLRTIAEGVPMSIVLFDADERILFANAEFALLGDSSAGVEGKTAQQFLAADLYEKSRPARARALAGERVRFEATVRIGEESRVREVTYSPYRDSLGRIRGVYALGYDVTQIHRSRERIRDMAQRLASVREGEKVSLSATLHEHVAQDLFAVRLRLQELASDLGDDGRLRGIVSEVAVGIESTVAELRRLTNDLVPISLANLPLATTLRMYAEGFAPRHGLQLSFRTETPLPDTSIDVRLLLFRAMQQSLDNTREHAGASTVTILLRADAVALELSIVDDGQGIRGEAADRAGAHGLLFFSERFGALGGRFSVQRGAQGGTVVTAVLPLAALNESVLSEARGLA
jgi:PAS domain S-box-containing protein